LHSNVLNEGRIGESGTCAAERVLRDSSEVRLKSNGQILVVKFYLKKIDHFITYEIAIYSKMYLPKGWDMKLFPPLKRTKTLASSCQSLTSSTS
jgi:hypothetical protein